LYYEANAEAREMMVKIAKQGSAKTSAQLLEEMVAEMARLGPSCEPELVEWGPDRGSEIIDDAYSRGEIAPPPDDRQPPGASTKPRTKPST
jgi:antitoxin MazE